MPLRAEVRLNLNSFKRLKRVVTKDGRPVYRLLREWIRIYRRWLYDRFVKFSRGGGNWPDLKPGTKAAKTRQGFGTEILIRTRVLEEQFSPVSRTQIISARQGAVIRFGAGKTYPDGTPVEDVIRWHNDGAGNLPVRELLPDPDASVVRDMVKIAEQEMQDEIDGT